MNIKELQNIMYDAMKNKDKLKKETIASIINTAKNVAIANNDKDNITDEIVNNAIAKELKVINEQIETCPKDRTETLNEFTLKKEIVTALMPKQMTKEEIIAFIKENFAEVLESKNKGLIMKNVMSALKGKADGKLINNTISEMI